MTSPSSMDLRNSISVIEQRIFIKFAYLKGETAAEAHRQLKKYIGKNALAESTCRFWMKQFKGQRFNVEESRGGNHNQSEDSEERINIVREAFDQSRAWSMKSLSHMTSIPQATVHRIVRQKLLMKKICRKWVPHELSESQREMRETYSKVNLKNFKQQKSRLQHTITVDETWISLYRQPEKDQAREWLGKGEKATSVTVADRYGPKVMLICAMDITGICYYEFLDEKETVNATRYLQFLKNLWSKWHKNRRHVTWFLDDNARPHRNASVKAWIEEKEICRWLQPAYSPDLSPCDYGCFHQLKRALGGVQYASVAELKAAVDKEVLIGKQNGKYLAVAKLPDRWEACQKNEGQYL